MSSTTDAELLYLPDAEAHRFLPEGPTPLGPGRFSWVAIQHGPKASTGSLNIFDVTSRQNQSFNLPGRPGFAKPSSDEQTFLVGCERQLGLFHIGDNTWNVLESNIDTNVAGTIINDATLFGNNLIFGTKDLEFKTKKAGLYLYRGCSDGPSPGELFCLRNDQICSNGKVVIDTGSAELHLYDIDSPTRTVVRYRLNVEQGTLSPAEVILDLTELESVPDGMTPTPDGDSVIISFYNPNPAEFGETRQYNLRTAQLEHTWRTPLSPQPTCPALLPMPDGSVKLIITTAVEHMPAQRRSQSPHAGGLFIADTPFTLVPSQPRWPARPL